MFSVVREPDFKYTFAKLCDMTTVKEESNIDNGVKLGIDIDIFPLDSCSSHILNQFVQKRIQFYQVGCVLSKFNTSEGKPFVKRCVINYCRTRGYSYFHNKLVKLICKEIERGSTYKGCLMWPVYGAREVLPAEVFANSVKVEFEGEFFDAPTGYDEYLRSLYGDYEKDPPLEKQKTHHNFKAYRL